jgi:hypothetical protein
MFSLRISLATYSNEYEIHFLNSCRWSRLLTFPNIRTLHKGVLTLRFIRAHEHRAIAMALPYVLEGLLDQSSSAQACAIAYNQWRLELQADSYQTQQVPLNHLHSSGLGSLETLKAMGTKLQQLMNSLNAEFIHLKKHSKNRKRKQAEGEDTDIFEDTDDARSQLSASSKAGHVGEGCDNEDNVYNNDNATDVAAKNDITGDVIFVSISIETNLHILYQS